MRNARVLLVALGFLLGGCSADWWATPDQRGQHRFDRGAFADAAEHFRDPMRRGVALFRAGQFEEAAGTFGRVATEEGFFNRGNALVMTGKYEAAIESYDRALAGRPDWAAAKANREIARIRWKRLHPDVEDVGGTGGKLEADEIVFDGKPAKAGAKDEVEVGVGDTMSDDALRAVWLRRVQTRPADFLRAKFGYQFSRREAK